MDHQWVFPVIDYRVIDGDTIDVTLDVGWGLRYSAACRLFGIDTPEVRTKAGKLVKQVVERYLADKPLRCRSMDRGKYYGRFVGTIHVPDDVAVSSMLIVQKLCQRYDGKKKKPWTADNLAAVAERAAELLDADWS